MRCHEISYCVFLFYFQISPIYCAVLSVTFKILNLTYINSWKFAQIYTNILLSRWNARTIDCAFKLQNYLNCAIISNGAVTLIIQWYLELKQSSSVKKSLTSYIIFLQELFHKLSLLSYYQNLKTFSTLYDTLYIKLVLLTLCIFYFKIVYLLVYFSFLFK